MARNCFSSTIQAGKNRCNKYRQHQQQQNSLVYCNREIDARDEEDNQERFSLLLNGENLTFS